MRVKSSMDDQSTDIEEEIGVEMYPIRQTLHITPEQCISKWMEKHLTGSLSITDFKEHWRLTVPHVYSPPTNRKCLDWNFNEDLAQKLLFQPLEHFICNGNPDDVLPNLAQFDKPPSVCGRVFKMGEPTYSCRECGMDTTCVLCVDCFKQSAHRNHKYKMGTSTGGGCCDCGDDEAWKTEPYCDVHYVGKFTRTEESSSLPEDIAERARIVFDSVLWYAYNLLTLEHAPELPPDLRLKQFERDPLYFLETDDPYCTVLYNDETHTFEQVIGTLSRVIKCDQRDSIEYVTNIDREGRAVVKCSTFHHCDELKVEIEKYTSRHENKPLKVLVVHSHVIAHQTFALKLLSWLPAFLSHGEGFRAVFSKVAGTSKEPETSIVEGVLLRDSQMWKSARTHWHRLLIAGMLMEYENKKQLAIIFTKNYAHHMKDFIRDDHDHSFSVSSLSVQIFTVPTLAHYLIAKEDVLFKLLNTFISECSRKCNRQGKLQFERNASNRTLKRALFILHDLRYLLSLKPKEWTDDLRRGFLHGLSVILDLLTMMQDMDAVTRQVGQHMEYEPEWESAFNLHIKLACVISLALEWCGSDLKVLLKAYKLTLKKLYEHPSYDANLTEVQELADHAATCLQYNVASQPISIHLPLSRFLAGLHLYLEPYDLHFVTSFQVLKPTPEQIMEPVLRTQAMISQVNAGMWRRNGYALLNQLYFYHNVKCRTEMLDRDIVLLQIAASLIESNEFLIHILNKYNLMNWVAPDFEITSLDKTAEEDSMRQTINLVEEFLGLLVTIIGERYIPGIGKVTLEDRIKKEIIQQLCIKPLPHSELNKTIPEEIVEGICLDSVINEVAVFKKPTRANGKGVYELKPEYYEHYNVFFYHYTREELSKSEEAQRKRRKLSEDLECCPPPDLPELTEAFNMVTNLLQSDVMLHVMKTVLERSVNLRARSFSEPQLHKVLHLIGYALREQQSHRYPFLLFTERANKWQLFELMQLLSNSARVESHKDLIVWTMNKYKEVALPNSDKSMESSSKVKASQSTVDPTKEEKDRRAKLAAQRRAKVMAQMAAMQNSFMKENAKLFEETVSEASVKTHERTNATMEVTENSEATVCLGKEQTTRLNVQRKFTCILCQEEQNVTKDGPALVMAAFVQQSTVLCQEKFGEEIKSLELSTEPLYMAENLGPSSYTSTCGHVMHSCCWQKYFENIVSKENRRPFRNRHPGSFDIEKQEYLCPLCECLSNTVLPLIPPLVTLQPSITLPDLSFDDWLKGLELASANKVKNNCSCTRNSESESTTIEWTHPVSYSCPSQNVFHQLGEQGKAFSFFFTAHDLNLSDNLVAMIQLFSQTAYTKGLDLHPDTDDFRFPLLAWKTCSYTIRTMEILLRDLNKPLLGDLSCRQKDCLENLVRLVGVLGNTWKKQSVIASHSLRLLSLLFDTSDGACILEWDSFGVLIPLVLSLPSLFSRDISPVPSGSLQDLYILKLVFLSYIAKSLILDFTEDDMMDIDIPEELSTKEQTLITDILKLINKYRDGVNTHKVWNDIKDRSIPFLRCCALFFHFLTDVPPPPSLKEVGRDTFTELCNYLGLKDSCEELLQPLLSHNLISRWYHHPNIEKYFNDKLKNNIPVPNPLFIPKLVPLPNDYSDLINTVSLFTCPNSDRDDSRNPTMCLVCGEMLCSQSYCCQTNLNKSSVGACNYHTHVCGAGVGIFLRVRECEILFLASPNRGCFVSPPYLDDYGETDQGLRRGNALHLCEERYKKLHTLWLGHSLHEEIARAIETSSSLVSTQWQHL